MIGNAALPLQRRANRLNSRWDAFRSGSDTTRPPPDSFRIRWSTIETRSDCFGRRLGCATSSWNARTTSSGPIVPSAEHAASHAELYPRSCCQRQKVQFVFGEMLRTEVPAKRNSGGRCAWIASAGTSSSPAKCVIPLRGRVGLADRRRFVLRPSYRCRSRSNSGECSASQTSVRESDRALNERSSPRHPAHLECLCQ